MTTPLTPPLPHHLPTTRRFVGRKEGELERRAEELTRKGARLKARIKLVIGGLQVRAVHPLLATYSTHTQELQQIGLEEGRKPQRDIFS